MRGSVVLVLVERANMVYKVGGSDSFLGPLWIGWDWSKINDSYG